ncbi:N-acetyltransferase [Clostridium botulinum]|uniref:GNAT family N-acetyltransferase n=1 Tax=Clostridium botulinum TaxID=1491 RepID=UPI000174E5EF|nr:N-acetyltransferase [Clostridium botulinum]ACD53627.1 acetyltransferase, gnat family [Clostridium botulinum E3 str. Alaska E43]AJF29762.1 GCN5 family acetyltransferase [Clostridium botulinum]AJF32823.1 GCN5 family acetyltransferase [Clostridium botulinum]MBN1064903.1 N-acetyltransferase [Clostridium botulinum]MBY6789067.1 N-acetyltransferase [Clostridium botulinum]
MSLKIRNESKKDYKTIYLLVKDAFKTAEHSDGNEHNLIDTLRTSESYIPELSLLAEIDEKIVGYIMFTKLFIENQNGKFESLALAPLAVHPQYQDIGIGSKLIIEGLNIAKNLGFKSAIVLGSEKYYPKFGFKEASDFGIKAPFEVPSENFMVIELQENALKDINGNVIYAKEFFE